MQNCPNTSANKSKTPNPIKLDDLLPRGDVKGAGARDRIIFGLLKQTDKVAKPDKPEQA